MCVETKHVEAVFRLNGQKLYQNGTPTDDAYSEDHKKKSQYKPF